MNTWLVTKYVHVGSAAVSIALFVLRGLGSLADAPWVRARTLRVLPHVVDTVLLASAIGLMVMSIQYPLVQDWLTAKVVALLAYIALGMVALHSGASLRRRALAFGAGVVVFGYIVAVAVTRNPGVWW